MLSLLDYRRQITDLYRHIRDSDDAAPAWLHFRRTRDDLFRSHPQSALDEAQKAAFTGLPYYDYDPAYRVVVPVDFDVTPASSTGRAGEGSLDYDLGDDGLARISRFGRVNFSLPTGDGTLSLFWINGYGGGLFLPFGDATNRHTTPALGATYGAGRYLYDTIKGADLGASLTHITLDFNFAYNPSCAYNPRWVCPLAPPENRLPFPVLVGEMTYPYVSP